MEVLGENIKLARLRRKFTSEQVAERAGIVRSTLWKIERVAASVSIGTYLQILFVLGLEKDFEKLATNDVMGRKLQDAGFLTKKRAPKKVVRNKIEWKMHFCYDWLFNTVSKFVVISIVIVLIPVWKKPVTTWAFVENRNYSQFHEKWANNHYVSHCRIRLIEKYPDRAKRWKVLILINIYLF